MRSAFSGTSRSKKALVAILGVNHSLFDIMPTELRAHSKVVLALTKGEKLGEFKPDADRAAAGADRISP